MTTGGVDLAVKTVENEWLCNGNAHLIDNEMLKKVKKMDLCASFCCDCWSFLIMVAMIYFTVMYFMLINDEVKMKKGL